MLVTILLFILGLICLIYGGNWFIDGSIMIAKKLNLPEFIIGATIVSIGTTLPEVLVSTEAAILGNGSIAYGNAIGSIICNTAFICALTLAIKPQSINTKSLKAPIYFFIIAAVFYSIVAYFFDFNRWIGITLLTIYVIYIKFNLSNKNQYSIQEKEIITNNYTCGCPSLIIWGAISLAIGATLLVNKGTILAQLMGVPDSVIGLTLVALGTSLPELTTAIMSLKRGHSELSIGNIVGANLLNLIFVSGMAITISPFDVPIDKTLFGINSSLIVDIPLMFLVMGILTVPTLINKRTSRWQGILLLCIYAWYVIYQFNI